jgi:type I restriction enzyme, R subunit
VPFEDMGGTMVAHYYQEVAVNKVMGAIAEEKQRILLTMATGTGKTFVAFQIAWKLFQTRWNLRRDGARRPRILFLADRNILANQAFNAFGAFEEDAMIRISPKDIAKKGKVPTNGSIFFTIFQTFMSGPNDTPYFGEYPKDFFDFVIIDECHRGGANDESNWRGILDYFSPAVQLGMTATPKRKDNVDTYRYFGEPVYIYSLKQGINDGFLTPFKVRRVKTTIDDYIYTSDDTVIEGEVEEGKIYEEADFNKIIEIKERERKRVQVFMNEINQKEKAIVFCATQDHAAAVRDLVNQNKKSIDVNYCVRVTANDGERGEQYLREFQDNEKTIPTILTTSQKLSTGVDARNIRSIILMRPINTMIEFKQIVGRGTRLFDGKEYFTIYDFVDAYHHFADPEWDGEPVEDEPCSKCGNNPCTCEKKPPKPCPICGQRPCICEKGICPICEMSPCICKKKVKIKLADGKEREIQHMISTSFWSADGTPISADEFLRKLYGKLPEFFKSEDELRKIWSYPMTRKALLDKLADAGYGKEELSTIQSIINAEKSDLFDVLEYISFAVKPITREVRVAEAQSKIFAMLNNRQKEFLEFVLSQYIETGVEELDQDKLPDLLTLKYQAINDAVEILGGTENIRTVFVDFQKYLYERKTA